MLKFVEICPIIQAVLKDHRQEVFAMTTHKNITRILAVLLAACCSASSPRSRSRPLPRTSCRTCTTVRPTSGDADVNDLLSQTLLSNFASDVGTQEWEYKATSTLSGGATKWVPVTGTTAGIIPRAHGGQGGLPRAGCARRELSRAGQPVSRAGLRRAPEGARRGLHVHEAGAARMMDT